jgi:hypothetical protein
LRVHDRRPRGDPGPETGRNFAAGMSGGIAYVWDRAGDFRHQAATWAWSSSKGRGRRRQRPKLRELIERHLAYTGSPSPSRFWPLAHRPEQFVKVMPIDYHARKIESPPITIKRPTRQVEFQTTCTTRTVALQPGDQSRPLHEKQRVAPLTQR